MLLVPGQNTKKHILLPQLLLNLKIFFYAFHHTTSKLIYHGLQPEFHLNWSFTIKITLCTSSRKKEEEIFIFELPFSFFRTDSLCSIESETTHLTTRLSLSLRLIPGPPPPPSIKQNACWQNPLREDLHIFFSFCAVRKRHLLLSPWNLSSEGRS